MSLFWRIGATLIFHRCEWYVKSFLYQSVTAYWLRDIFFYVYDYLVELLLSKEWYLYLQVSKYVEARNREWQWRKVHIKFVTYVYQTSICTIFTLGDNEVDKSLALGRRYSHGCGLEILIESLSSTTWWNRGPLLSCLHLRILFCYR